MSSKEREPLVIQRSPGEGLAIVINGAVVVVIETSHLTRLKVRALAHVEVYREEVLYEGCPQPLSERRDEDVD